MNQHCAIIQQKQSNFGGCGEEMMMMKNVSVVCPKPRRVARFDVVNEHFRSLPWHVSEQQEWCDRQAMNELFDIILAKDTSGGVEKQSASSSRFFSGSPPSRVSNPLIQDARFGDEKIAPVAPRALPMPSGLGPSPSSNTRKGGCVREISFGNNPSVRVEGFDCLAGERRAASIPALA